MQEFLYYRISHGFSALFSLRMYELKGISRKGISDWIWRFSRRGIFLSYKRFYKPWLFIRCSLVRALLNSSFRLTLRNHLSMPIESLIHCLLRFIFNLTWPNNFSFFMSDFGIYKVWAFNLSLRIISKYKTLTPSISRLLLFFYAFILKSSRTWIHWNWISYSLIKWSLSTNYWYVLI